MTQNELRHYGVKGMKWGVRRERLSALNAKRKAPTDVELTEKPGDFVRSRGGRNQSSSEDARTAQVYRQKARASTTDSLSNKVHSVHKRLKFLVG